MLYIHIKRLVVFGSIALVLFFYIVWYSLQSYAVTTATKQLKSLIDTPYVSRISFDDVKGAHNPTRFEVIIPNFEIGLKTEELLKLAKPADILSTSFSGHQIRLKTEQTLIRSTLLGSRIEIIPQGKIRVVETMGDEAIDSYWINPGESIKLVITLKHIPFLGQFPNFFYQYGTSKANLIDTVKWEMTQVEGFDYASNEKLYSADKILKQLQINSTTQVGEKSFDYRILANKLIFTSAYDNLMKSKKIHNYGEMLIKRIPKLSAIISPAKDKASAFGSGSLSQRGEINLDFNMGITSTLTGDDKTAQQNNRYRFKLDEKDQLVTNTVEGMVEAQHNAATKNDITHVEFTSKSNYPGDFISNTITESGWIDTLLQNLQSKNAALTRDQVKQSILNIFPKSTTAGNLNLDVKLTLNQAQSINMNIERFNANTDDYGVQLQSNVTLNPITMGVSVTSGKLTFTKAKSIVDGLKALHTRVIAEKSTLEGLESFKSIMDLKTDFWDSLFVFGQGIAKADATAPDLSFEASTDNTMQTKISGLSLDELKAQFNSKLGVYFQAPVVPVVTLPPAAPNAPDAAVLTLPGAPVTPAAQPVPAVSPVAPAPVPAPVPAPAPVAQPAPTAAVAAPVVSPAPVAPQAEPVVPPSPVAVPVVTPAPTTPPAALPTPEAPKN